MSIFYRIVLILLALAAAYSLYGIIHFKWMEHSVRNPDTEFLIAGNEEADETLVLFTYYQCGYCKEIDPLIEEVLKVRKDLRYVVRPVVFAHEEMDDETRQAFEEADKYTRLALAAGLQGHFWDLHRALMEYPEMEIPDDFIEETAGLYGIDYDQLIKDSNSKQVKKLARSNLAALEYTGIPLVPSFMINNKTYNVSDSLPDLKQLLTIISSAETP
jgi:protein-disulfide isomerase